ncbi:cysteine--1-D-myo-inosityl 2-amino-2-deoxy-alpha-D-glucopyranoside ligase [Parenemella sanctibonifatiensis]|uniref:L-cysteine:1D-myo-inositol 2-amino-2-deoxy-alpha-D-glucopyranoside ligase n=1 Tax=Parenemella sanctibonifatiensis TaxID=2016505 RepID=A0A255EP18_9ACTN|nr:cysteine--1-D-myo-inosityl 2-amino-2-deoxy-alpha-D-glucopyranoside ligase [Parenemella sanctibonifatiensis]OYN91335.1 cysteine--1-D-myo-inosityl 2-amino-2-deoxy-alpha-D-glucopyranoside ligase [Parenemella sanctibonifatiensis]
MQSWSVPLPRPVSEIPGGSEDPTPLRLHDTRAGELQEVGPEHGTARMYVCGITPYDATHMGHANTYVAFDLVNRVWRDRGLAVAYAQNVTDVDDPLLERATATGVDWQQLALDQTQLFREDMTALNVLPPEHFVGAVESIGLIDEANERTRERLYQVEEDWYFALDHPEEVPLVALGREEAFTLFGERGGDPERPGKRHPLDALVWQGKRDGEPFWPSSLGAGRPGWHIECAVICQHRLGADIDLQGGGSDLVFPHHSMSAAHAEVLDGPLAQHYAHGGMVGLDGEKMSKSKGNLVLVSELRARGVDPMAIRLALLNQHYRTDWSWTEELLQQAMARLERWRTAVARPGADPSDTIAAVRAALRNDLDAAAALAAVDAWAEATPGTEASSEHSALLGAAVDALLGVRL